MPTRTSPRNSRQRIVGVDGCRAGWVSASRELGEATVRVEMFASFADVAATAGDAAVIAVDIPIGLPDAGQRPTDRDARHRLGARGSSVFPAPLRVTLEASSYADACERSFAVSGKKLSKQSYNILPKIREVDALLRAHATLRARVSEVHPELSFTERNNGVPMRHAKKTADGRVERLRLLSADARRAYELAMANTRRADVASDDVIDALIALWSAERIATGTAIRIPSGPIMRDACGLPMCIHA